MDMGGDMDMGGGMDMSSDGLFKTDNVAIALAYWYLIAAIVGLLGVIRLVGYAHRFTRFVLEGRYA